MSTAIDSSAGVVLSNPSDYRIDVEMGFFPQSSEAEAITENSAKEVKETTIEIASVTLEESTRPNLREAPTLKIRKIAPVSHWSTKVAWVATTITGITAASGIFVWAVPSLNGAIPYGFYVAVPTGIISAIAHGISAGYLSRFIPQKALEESVEVAEGVTLTAKEIVKKLKELEADLGERNKDIAKLTHEREMLSRSLEENIGQFTGQIEDFRRQNDLLQTRVLELSSQIEELNKAKEDLLSNLESFRRENGSLKETISRASQLGAQAKVLIQQMGLHVDSLDGAEDDIALQVQALSQGIKELKSTTEQQRLMLKEITDAREATKLQNEVIIEKLALLEKAKADLQAQLELLQQENGILSSSIGKFIDISADVAENARFFDAHDDQFVEISEKLSGTEAGLRELIKIQGSVIKNRDASILKLQEQITSLKAISEEVHRGGLETQDILVALDAQEKKFNEEIAKLTAQITSYEEVKEKKEQEIDRLKGQVARLEGHISDYRTINAQMESNLVKLTRKIEEASKRGGNQ
jgi:chromosome segregation ATPase